MSVYSNWSPVAGRHEELVARTTEVGRLFGVEMRYLPFKSHRFDVTVEKRDRALGLSTAEKRRQRADLQQLARPQSGVDDLKGKFPRPVSDIPGVTSKAAGARMAPSR